MMTRTNLLYFGDNLEVLRKHLSDESVDLIYLDPPFNSKKDYNLIFADEKGETPSSQIRAFEDTWHWGEAAERAYGYLTDSNVHQGRVPSTVSRLIGSMRAAIGENDVMAYVDTDGDAHDQRTPGRPTYLSTPVFANLKAWDEG